MVATPRTPTDIRSETLGGLRQNRRGAKSSDNVPDELMDDVPSDEFLAEIERRSHEPNLPWSEVERSAFGRRGRTRRPRSLRPR